ncbi:MAG: NRAMP family divalent metal transporter [Thermomicrobiales bacterium]
MNKNNELRENLNGILPIGAAERDGAIALTAAPTAVLDAAHVGDIQGAWGTIRQHQYPPRRSLWKRFMALLAIMGPGLIVMIGDNDAGGVATYTQAGQDYGTSLLWTLLLLVPVLIVNQEMVVRLGAVIGVGHARLIFERFGKFWGAFSVIDLFLLNFLTIVTEFIGVTLAMQYFGVSQYLSVPVAAVLLILMTITGSFRRWERFMFLFIVTSLLMIPLAFMVHASWQPVLRDTLIPTVQGGLDSTALLLIIAIVGTTVAPWQLFFQQSNIVDKRITPRWITYERADTFVGALLTNVGAAALMIAAAFAFKGTALAGQFSDSGVVAAGLRDNVGSLAGAFLAIILLNAGVIGAAAVTLSTSYAFGDVFNARHSLHRKAGNAKLFYGIYAFLVMIAAGIVLIPNAPLQLMTLAVQALAGLLLPSATVFLVLLRNDRDVLGPWVNARWLNVVASIIVGVLLILSLILVVATLFPDINATLISLVAGIVLAAGLLVMGLLSLRSKEAQEPAAPVDRQHKANWRMPPLAELPKPVWSMTRKVGMLMLRGYLLVAAVLLVVKVIQLVSG